MASTAEPDVRTVVEVRKSGTGDPIVVVNGEVDSVWVSTRQTPNAWRNANMRAARLRRERGAR